MDTEILDQLKKLHTHAIDARNGYQEALDDAEGKGLTGLFSDMIALHTRNASELSAEITRHGETVSDDGSFMSTVHKTIMSIRSLFNGLGDSVLPGLVDGEERNLSASRAGLNRSDLQKNDRLLLQSQSERIQRAIARMKEMEATAKADNRFS